MTKSAIAQVHKKRGRPEGPSEETLAKHSKNPKLSVFLSQRRGIRSLQEMQKLIGSSYYRWEVEGRLPPRTKTLQRLAEALGCSVETLTDLVPKTANKGGADVLPLLRNLTSSNLTHVTWNEFLLLFQIQRNFKETLSPKLAEALVDQNRLQTEK